MGKNWIIFLFISIISNLYPDYPVIESLNSKNILFKQISSDINLSYKRAANSKNNIPLIIMKYIRSTENIFQFASRMNLPYEAIVTLNKINNPEEFLHLKEILIPNQAALFIPDKPTTDIELFLSGRKFNGEKIVITVNNKIIDFFMIPDARFNKTERSLFLNTFFRFPIEKGKITSFYGNRLHPMTGKLSFHNGIDIAAPIGTDVFSSAAGEVYETNYNSILGSYIIIEHPAGLYTIYGHLSKTLVSLNSKIKTGTIIGKVGNSGYSTGPHLHFEIRKKGESADPLKYIRRKDK